jgi:hypothetical protein
MRALMRDFVMKRKRGVPWPAKMGVKLVLARVPIDWKVWHSFVFRHGDMDSPSHALKATKDHLRLAFAESEVPAGVHRP